MIVHRNGQSFLCVRLADAMAVKVPREVGRLGDVELRQSLFGIRRKFLVEDALAKRDAIVADVNARSCDELFYFRVRFSAKTAERDVAWPRHS